MTKTPVWCIASLLIMCNVVGNTFETAVAAPAAHKTAGAVASSTVATAVSGKPGKNSVATPGALASPSGNASITFPETKIGKLYALQKNWDVVQKRIDGKFFCVAKGKVSVQPDVPLSLKLDWVLTTRPQLLVVTHSNIVQIYGDGIEFDDTICEPISKIPSVVRVDLSQSDVTDAGITQLSKMKQLKALNISKTLVKGSCLQALSGPELLFLDISENNLDHSNYKYLALLDHLVSARFNCDNLTDESLKSIGQMKSLRALEIRGNLKLTDDGMKYLFPLKNLQHVTIRDARITVSGVEALLKNTKMKTLTVEDKILANATGMRLLRQYPKILNSYRDGTNRDVDTLYAPLK
jgi:Leucine Rich repeat